MKTAQDICDAIDTLFGDTSRPVGATLADMDIIARRAGSYAALPANAEEEECFEEVA